MVVFNGDFLRTSLLCSVNCFECGDPVPFQSLDEHMIESHGYIKCPACSGFFGNLDAHIDKDHGKKLCSECGVVMDEKRLGSHIKNSH